MKNYHFVLYDGTMQHVIAEGDALATIESLAVRRFLNDVYKKATKKPLRVGQGCILSYVRAHDVEKKKAEPKYKDPNPINITELAPFFPDGAR